MFDTAHLPDIVQRKAPIEHIGMVIGTCGTLPYIHLQLAVAERMFGRGGLPTLVVNDGGAEHGAADLQALCDDYGAEFWWGDHLGHSVGDLRVFQKGFEWAEANNIQILAKFSRRFVPLVPWRHELRCLASMNQHCAAFTRKHMDSPGGLFRTDAIALRVRKWQCGRVGEVFAESMGMSRLNVESLIEGLCNVIGGWEMWPLLGRDFYRPYTKALQWRGILPSDYGDLSRYLGLPYKDKDFGCIPATAAEKDESWRGERSVKLQVLGDAEDGYQSEWDDGEKGRDGRDDCGESGDGSWVRDDGDPVEQS